jgi:hypothetical protein
MAKPTVEFAGQSGDHLRVTLRLAGRVVPGPDRGVWLLDPAGLPVHAEHLEVRPGTPVAVGPRSAGAKAVTAVLAALDELVTRAGAVVAGADIDLGAGFRSARIDGGAGDRRDGVLAALTVPGLIERLGERSSVLVALFGATATKPLGAAAQAAVDEGRWPALRLAVAASDVLGPEKLVELVRLRAPASVDPFPQGLPSLVGRHLTQLLSPFPGHRRLKLLMDLWDQVCADGLERQRRDRLRASQGRQDRMDDLLRRYWQYEEDELRDRLQAERGFNLTFTQIALWQPSTGYWLTRATRVIRDVFAATVLARVAVTAADHGVDKAIEAHRAEIEAAVADLSSHEASSSARVIPGLTGLPARPGSYLRDIHRRAGHSRNRSSQDRTYELSRLVHARDYGRLMLQTVHSLVLQINGVDRGDLRDNLAAWAQQPLTVWRDRVGFLSPNRLQTWEQRPLLTPDDAEARLLRERLEAQPDEPAAAVEMIGDLFWYAELADALAQLNGYPAAIVHPGWEVPAAEIDAEAPKEPLVPSVQSVVLAAAGATQLVELGGQIPRRCRTWSELVAGLLETASVSEALTGAFPVSPEITAADASLLPGTQVRIEVARNGRQLADWSDYMGNCIASPHYADRATAARSALLALRAPDGTIAANVELKPTGHGWRINEIRARFNQDPDPQLVIKTRDWLNTLARPISEPAEPAHALRERSVRARPPSSARLVRDLGARLQPTVVEETGRPETIRAGQIMAEVSRWMSRNPAPHTEPEAALTALRRAGISTLVRAVEQSLGPNGDLGLTNLWNATADRPLQRAVAALRPAESERLQALLFDLPLPGSLRPLARLPHIAPARTRHLVALRLRRAIGVLTGQDSAELAEALNTNPDSGLIRAAALAITSRGGIPLDRPRLPGPAEGAVTAVSSPRRVHLPGYPASSLNDDLWQGAWPDAVELGGTPETFWDHVAAHGLLVPTSWIPHSWPVLWARAVKGA